MGVYNKIYIDILRSNSEDSFGAYRGGWVDEVHTVDNNKLDSTQKEILVQLSAILSLSLIHI